MALTADGVRLWPRWQEGWAVKYDMTVYDAWSRASCIGCINTKAMLLSILGKESLLLDVVECQDGLRWLRSATGLHSKSPFEQQLGLSVGLTTFTKTQTSTTTTPTPRTHTTHPSYQLPHLHIAV